MIKSVVHPQILKAANMIMHTMNTYYPADILDPWVNKDARQMGRDALQSMKLCHLINDYNLETGEIT